MKQNLVKNLRRLLETQVSQAEVMIAAKNFSDELQEMVEKVGRLQNEDLPPVVSQMRETYGTESSSAFQTQIYSAFQSVMDTLYTAKNQIDDAVDSMAREGRVSQQTDMDSEVPMDGTTNPSELDIDNIDVDTAPGNVPPEESDLDNIGDPFGAAEVEEPLGRERKTDVQLKEQIAQLKKLVEAAKRIKKAA